MHAIDYQAPGIKRQSPGRLALWFACSALATAAGGWALLIWAWQSVALGTMCLTIILASPVLAIAGASTGIVNIAMGIGPKWLGALSVVASAISFAAVVGELIYFLHNLPNC